MTERSADSARTDSEHPAVALTGLDGANPLGFLAALGVLRVLDVQAAASRTPRPLLTWTEAGHWYPVVTPATRTQDIVEAILTDRDTWKDDPALNLAYDESGEQLVDPRASNSAFVRELKPKPSAMREFHERIARTAEEPQFTHNRLLSRRAMDTAAAFGSELAQDNKGNTKPTGFHFSAGQQRFLDAAVQLCNGIEAADIEEALFGPWLSRSKLPSLSWDASATRFYALRATNPSSEKRGSTPGADWLAFIGMGCFPVTPQGRELRTTGIRGRWKTSTFTWPLWTTAVTARVARALIATPNLGRMTPEERRYRGIATILSSSITRTDQGGYGAFTPARVI